VRIVAIAEKQILEPKGASVESNIFKGKRITKQKREA
jgi:hypothetical protein